MTAPNRRRHVDPALKWQVFGPLAGERSSGYAIWAALGAL